MVLSGVNSTSNALKMTSDGFNSRPRNQAISADHISETALCKNQKAAIVPIP